MVVSRKINYSTEPGARILAKRIEKFWKTAGYEKVLVAPTALKIGDFRDRTIFVIQSNIGIGGPPR